MNIPDILIIIIFFIQVSSQQLSIVASQLKLSQSWQFHTCGQILFLTLFQFQLSKTGLACVCVCTRFYCVRLRVCVCVCVCVRLRVCAYAFMYRSGTTKCIKKNVERVGTQLLQRVTPEVSHA